MQTVKIEKGLFVIERKDGIERRSPLGFSYYNILNDDTIKFILGVGVHQESIDVKLSELEDENGDTFATINDFISYFDSNQGLTDSQLRATPVPISGTVTANTGLTQPLTDTQLRATAVPISPRPNTTGSNGTTPYKLISTASTNANVVKNSGGNLYSIVAIGLTSTVRYLKLYSKATAPTVGTDVPLMTIPVPANTQGAGVAIPFSMGVNFPLGIGIAITSGSANNDTGAVGAGDVIINLTYA